MALVVVLFILNGWLAIVGGNTGSNLKIEIDPERTAVALLPVTISCEVVRDLGDIVLISISKDQDTTIAAIRQGQNNVTFGAKDVLRFQAEGKIEKGVAGRRYLSLTILHPMVQDAGIYFCSVAYFDDALIFKQDKASSNLIVDSKLNETRLETVLGYLGSKVASLEREVKVLSDKNSNLEREVKVLSENSSTQSRLIQANVDSVTDGQRTHFLLSQQIKMVDNRITETIAFTAGLKNSNMILKKGTVVFPNSVEQQQQGTGYNNQTGIFTAPKAGLYAFFLGVIMGNRAGAYLSIRKNIYQILVSVRAYDRDHNDHSSASTWALLDAGDEVRVWVEDIFGTYPTVLSILKMSVFSGYLIKPL